MSNRDLFAELSSALVEAKEIQRASLPLRLIKLTTSVS